MLQSASGLYVMEGPLHPEKSCLWKDSNDDRVSVDLLRFNLFELQVVGSVLFSTARPTSGSRPPSRVRIHPCFFSGGVGGFSECSKDAAICTCRMLSPVLRRSFPCAQLELWHSEEYLCNHGFVTISTYAMTGCSDWQGHGAVSHQRRRAGKLLWVKWNCNFLQWIQRIISHLCVFSIKLCLPSSCVYHQFAVFVWSCQELVLMERRDSGVAVSGSLSLASHEPIAEQAMWWKPSSTTSLHSFNEGKDEKKIQPQVGDWCFWVSIFSKKSHPTSDVGEKTTTPCCVMNPSQVDLESPESAECSLGRLDVSTFWALARGWFGRKMNDCAGWIPHGRPQIEKNPFVARIVESLFLCLLNS